jgi:hypothetical protein
MNPYRRSARNTASMLLLTPLFGLLIALGATSAGASGSSGSTGGPAGNTGQMPANATTGHAAPATSICPSEWQDNYQCFPCPPDYSGNVNYNNIEGPITEWYSPCTVRVWLHEYTDWSNGNGWAYCMSPESSGDVPSKYQIAENVYVSDNPDNC